MIDQIQKENLETKIIKIINQEIDAGNAENDWRRKHTYGIASRIMSLFIEESRKTHTDRGWNLPLTEGFKVFRRNYGHWDIWNDKGRIFAVRGGPGEFFIRDEREMRGCGPSKQWP